MGKRFAILDRDGTIIFERNYLSSPERVELLPNAAPGLRALRAMGFGLLVITNQSGIGRGYFTADKVDSIHMRLRELLAKENIILDGVYVCPHTPEAACTCRKPETGLVQRAVVDLGFNPQEAVVIGDKACDIGLGFRIGAKTILVKTGYGAEYLATGGIAPDLVAADLKAAAELLEQ
jgi:D-glycero-D-manno-heptose 1,7-bisphosphate phosphatase